MDELRQAVGEGRRGGIFLVTAAPGDGKSETALEAERILSEAFGTQGYLRLIDSASLTNAHRAITHNSSKSLAENSALAVPDGRPAAGSGRVQR
jgi:CRISPR-associated endonuclease/helicase Cas3